MEPAAVHRARRGDGVLSIGDGPGALRPPRMGVAIHGDGCEVRCVVEAVLLTGSAEARVAWIRDRPEGRNAARIGEGDQPTRHDPPRVARRFGRSASRRPTR